VGVAADLQVEADLRRCRGGARLVRQQHARRTRRRAAHGRRGIAALARVEMVAGVIGHAGQHQWRPVMLQHHVLVVQHPQAQAPESGTQPCTPE
jgi:hypothetical protein